MSGNMEWSSSIHFRLREALAQAWKAGQGEGWDSISKRRKGICKDPGAFNIDSLQLQPRKKEKSKLLMLEQAV